MTYFVFCFISPRILLTLLMALLPMDQPAPPPLIPELDLPMVTLLTAIPGHLALVQVLLEHTVILLTLDTPELPLRDKVTLLNTACRVVLPDLVAHLLVLTPAIRLSSSTPDTLPRAIPLTRDTLPRVTPRELRDTPLKALRVANPDLRDRLPPVLFQRVLLVRPVRRLLPLLLLLPQTLSPAWAARPGAPWVVSLLLHLRTLLSTILSVLRRLLLLLLLVLQVLCLLRVPPLQGPPLPMEHPLQLHLLLMVIRVEPLSSNILMARLLPKDTTLLSSSTTSSRLPSNSNNSSTVILLLQLRRRQPHRSILLICSKR